MKRLYRLLTNWEQWNFFVLYLPFFPVWCWYCIKSRSLWFFTASNPTITFGGLEGEGKKEMYAQLPSGWFPKTLYIEPKSDLSLAKQSIVDAGFGLPFVVKPDVGMKGILFRKIEQWEEWRDYHNIMPVTYMVQELIEYPLELSIFYYRFPTDNSETISGCIQKELLHVVGNGHLTLEQLIAQHPRASLRFQEMKHRHASRFDWVVPSGERYYLSYAGNHNRGARFVSLMHEVDDRLVTFFDALSRQTSFYYGRYDLKCHSLETLKQGHSFSILEYNGCGAEPNHIYDAGLSLRQVYKILLQHWSVLFRISAYNHQQGHRYWPFAKGWRFLKQARRHFAQLESID
ncbi:MAG: hypothetical protein ACKO41_00030 [Sphingomonadales bacterium]